MRIEMDVLKSYQQSTWKISGQTTVASVLFNECTVKPTTPASRHAMINNERLYISAKFGSTTCPGVNGDLLEAHSASLDSRKPHHSVDLCVLNQGDVPPVAFVECKFRKGPVGDPDKQKKMRYLFLSIQLKFNHMMALFRRDGISFLKKKYVVFNNQMAPIFRMAYNNYCVAKGQKLRFHVVSTFQLCDQLKSIGFSI